MIIIIPSASLSCFDTLEEAKTAALDLTEKYGRDAGGFTILEAKELGRYEHASPIWIEETERVDTGTAGEAVRVDDEPASERLGSLEVQGWDQEAKQPAGL